MAMYQHFADKKALLSALTDDGLTAWAEIVRSLHPREPMEWLEALGEAFLQFALTQPHRSDVTFFFPAAESPQITDYVIAGRWSGVSMMMVPMDHARSAGRLVDRPALEIALAVSALCQGLLSMYRAGRFSSEERFKRLYRAMVRRHLGSYARAGSRRTRR